jgi:hypothetical protein
MAITESKIQVTKADGSTYLYPRVRVDDIVSGTASGANPSFVQVFTDGKLTSSFLPSIAATMISNSAITADKIATNAVVAAKISANAVTAGKISANAVTADKISSNAITTAKISASAVTAAKLAASSVTTAACDIVDISAMLIAYNDNDFSACNGKLVDAATVVSFIKLLGLNGGGYTTTTTTTTG